MPVVEVNLGERSYVISIGRGNLADIGGIVVEKKATAAAVVSNPVIARHYAETVLKSLRARNIRADLIVLPAGERFKTLKTVSRIYDGLLEMKLDRRSAVIALGGGVIGDMAGFAAATYMRGVDYYQVPTTLLAQVDSSVGGKTGVDLPQGKNLVGAFYQPRAVLIDVATLDTLPVRELRSGLAEVVKHGIIYDQEFFQFLDSHALELLSRRAGVMEEAVRRSVEIKRDVVQQDEREGGLRAILNFGHTVGHAIETLTGYGRYRHGEACAVGMVTEALLAEREGFAEAGLAARIAVVLAKMKLPVNMDPTLSAEDIVRAVELDKKTLGGRIRLALAVRMGKCQVFEDISREALLGAIEAHRNWRI